MGKIGSALKQILEQEEADRQRMLLARDNAAKLLATAQQKSAQLITQAHAEAQQIIDVAKDRSVRECDSIRQEYASRQDRTLQRLDHRWTEIEVELAQDIAHRLVGYER